MECARLWLSVVRRRNGESAWINREQSSCHVRCFSQAILDYALQWPCRVRLRDTRQTE